MAAVDNRIPLFILAGPTAAGKTALSLELARAIGGEIISADSAQVFRGCDIGSAKLPAEQRMGIPHHLIDTVAPTGVFSVADFQRLAKAAARDIWTRGRLPLVVGGTGLFIRALLRGYRFSDEATPGPVRERILQMAQRDGWHAVHRLLRLVDPDSYRRIAPTDQRRTARALEVFWTSGRRLAHAPGPADYHYRYWVVTRPPASLKSRIEARVQAMLQTGFETEVGELLAAGVSRRAQCMQAIGYREMADWYRGWATTDERNGLIVRHTRQYAKRQLTWFRAEPDARWLDLSVWTPEQALAELVRSAEQLVNEATGKTPERR
ncbi:MAG: tRNA (adenosine(37)-N6)-dimethylallyltransferase MiaA [Thermaerobacter sp.]|nr:tRNA (adenosine(37)-N6)-dimethylallyltransferase MiaA [Thermaerobacter sp.]